jgi:pimeloyl-ACP methyl ester carboxylesterase
VGLETHIADVLGVLKYQQLSDVILVGHSYGGMVVSGVADRATEQIGSLVYLDAALPENGQAMSDFVLPERFASFLEGARRLGEGWKIPPIPAAQWGIDNIEDREWVDKYCGFHPLKSLTDKIALSGEYLSIKTKVFILASAYNPSPFRRFAERTLADPTWTNYEIPTHHLTAVTMPRETADLLLLHA